MLLSGIKAIAMGASTGGFDALEAILTRLPISSPPIVVAMHLQSGIPKLFAARLNELSRLTAKEAESGENLRQGHVLIAPGGMHMKVVNRMGKMSVQCYVGEKVHHVMPSADVLFESVAAELRQNAVGVLLTGIGADGAAGLLKMRRNGAKTIGQDENTCAVYGMPKVAKDIGAVEYELPLNKIADKILSFL